MYSVYHNYVTADMLARALKALAHATTTTFEELFLFQSDFDCIALKALCSTRHSHRKTMALVNLPGCKLTDEQACYLATALKNLSGLTILGLTYNDINFTGAFAIIAALHRHPALWCLKLQGNPWMQRT